MKKLSFILVLFCLLFPLSAHAVENGWWWNASEGGRGVNIEVQGDTLFLAIYAYDPISGECMWLSSGGQMTSTTSYNGDLWRYRNGQALGDSWISPAQETYGSVTVTFHDDSHATVRCDLSDKTVTMNIERFRFGSSEEPTPDPDPQPQPGSTQKEKTEMLRGHWWLTYTIVSTWHDDYDLWNMQLGTDGVDWFIHGVDQWGDPVVGNYNTEVGAWGIYDPGFTIDQFFVFQTDGNKVLSGCYYLIRSDGSWSDCYDLTGYKTATAHTSMSISRMTQTEVDESKSGEVYKNNASVIDQKIVEMYESMKALTQ